MNATPPDADTPLSGSADIVLCASNPLSTQDDVAAALVAMDLATGKTTVLAEDAKADVGSDESMDASDPPAASRCSRRLWMLSTITPMNRFRMIIVPNTMNVTK